MSIPLLTLDPVPTLIGRARAELPASFDFADAGRPVRASRAPGRLDVMGGIADYTGSLVCEMPIDRAAAVLVQSRRDREVQVFSFNLRDDHLPFTFRMSLDALARATAGDLRREFAAPGRQWAGYLAGCLFVLQEEGLIDLGDPSRPGVEITVYSTVPLGAGVSSSAAIEVATMTNLVDHLGLAGRLDALAVAALCQRVENRVVGAPCGVMDQVASCCGTAGSLMRMICQPHELLPPLGLPAGVRVVGINSHVKHSVGGGAYGRTRCAAFMAHAMIVAKMREIGDAAGRPMTADPTGGYLANLDPDDYKRFFRPYLPEEMPGRAFLDRHGPTADAATTVDPDATYRVQAAADHHVLENRRVRQFAAFLEKAAALDPSDPLRRKVLDKAGHLMYASHHSYGHNAGLGADECDVLVDLVRANEPAGLYGAKITGGGSGGTVAVLADDAPSADAAIARVMADYAARTGLAPDLIAGTSPGAWEVGTMIVGN